MVELVVNISEEDLDVLRRKAARQGRDVESFLMEHIHRMVIEGRDEEVRVRRDPLYALVPMFRSGIADLGQQHDHYLYGTPRR